MLPLYARLVGEAVPAVTGNPTPYFFKRVQAEPPVETPVWYPDRARGTAVGEIIACTDDWTGSWTGYGEVSVEKYITADLPGGRLPAIIDAGSVHGVFGPTASGYGRWPPGATSVRAPFCRKTVASSWPITRQRAGAS